MRAAEHAPRDRSHVLEGIDGLAEIVERGAVVPAERSRVIQDACARVFDNPINLWEVRFYTLRRERYSIRSTLSAVQRRFYNEQSLDEAQERLNLRPAPPEAPGPRLAELPGRAAKKAGEEGPPARHAIDANRTEMSN